MKNLTYLLVALIVLVSCRQNKLNEQSIAQQIVISNIWFRPGTVNRNTAAFLKITNNTEKDDTLFDVSSDLAKVTQIHETYDKGNDMRGMRHIEQLLIPAKSSMELKPGSFHVMLIGLNKDLSKNDSGSITLIFRAHEPMKISGKVK